MASLNRDQMDWLVLLCVNATVPAVLLWETHSGEITRTIAVVSGLVCLLFMNGLILTKMRARSGRDGQPISNLKVLGGAGLGLFAALVLGNYPLTVGKAV